MTWEHMDRARNQIAKDHEIVCGRGVIVYDVQARAWAVPGSQHVETRFAAEQIAKKINLIMMGQLSGPKIIGRINENQ